jgi:predicted ATPase
MSEKKLFVGHASELALLDEYFHRAIEGDQQLVLLEGEAGIGKTALLSSVAREHARSRKARVFYLSPPVGEPFRPVHHAALAATDQRLYKRLGGRRQAAEVARSVYLDWIGLLPIIGNVLAATLGTVERIRRRKAGTFLPSTLSVDEDIAALLAAARSKPLVLLIDNLEEADAGEIGRLEKLICDADKGARILIVGAYRSAAPGKPHPPVKRLLRTLPEADEFFVERRLGPLSREEVEELLHHRFRGTPVPPPFLDRLHQSTGGHPGAIHETLADLQFRGGIRRRSRRWEFETEIAMPVLHAGRSTVVDLESLPAVIAEILQAASLLGAEFDSSSLARLVDLDELTVEDRLAGATHYGLLEVCGEDVLSSDDFSTRFRFISPQIVPFLREMMPADRRATLEGRRAAAAPR